MFIKFLQSYPVQIPEAYIKKQSQNRGDIDGEVLHTGKEACT